MNQQEAKKIDLAVKKLLKEHLTRSPIIIAGISGGPDSVFLLHQINQFITEEKPDSKAKVIIAHLNHKLRPEADSEEDFVQNLCSRKQRLLFASKSIEIKKIAKEKKQNLEEVAREARYKFFRDLAKKHNASAIITGHHADDNLETILLNLTRGATLKGLTGMQISETAKGLTILRPLLNITKDQIISYLKLKKQTFKVDLSNFDNRLSRNFLRNDVIPLLKNINPSLPQTLSQNTSELREIENFLSTESNSWIKTHSLDQIFTSFPLKEFLNLHPAIQKQIIINLYHLHIKNLKNLSNKNIKEVIQLLRENKGNKEKKLGKIIFKTQKEIFKIET